jgi:hypothetical protein
MEGEKISRSNFGILVGLEPTTVYMVFKEVSHYPTSQYTTSDIVSMYGVQYIP